MCVFIILSVYTGNKSIQENLKAYQYRLRFNRRFNEILEDNFHNR